MLNFLIINFIESLPNLSLFLKLFEFSFFKLCIALFEVIILLEEFGLRKEQSHTFGIKKTIQTTSQSVGMHFLLSSQSELSISMNFKLGWYLQKIVQRSSENFLFNTQCSQYYIMTYLIHRIYVYLYDCHEPFIIEPN